MSSAILSPAQKELLVPLYFHLGGWAGGTMTLLALGGLGGREDVAPILVPGLVLSLGLLLISGAILTAHLGRPERFFRMWTRFKWTSPISLGAWGLLLGIGYLFAGLVCCSYGHGPAIAKDPTSLGLLLALGWVLAGYPGVLLYASSRPAWSSSTWVLGAFFLSSLANGAAGLILIQRWFTDLAPSLSVLGQFLAVAAAVAWVCLDGELRSLDSYRAQRGLMWVGLLLGHALPALVLFLPGIGLELGALMVLLASGGTRAALTFAGERS